MKLEKVLHGVARYIDSEVYAGMNDIQELVARLFVGRVVEKADDIKWALVENSIVRAFGIVDAEGDVDIDLLMHDIKREVEKKGKVSISIPMFGKLTFSPSDIDVIHRFVMEA
jgi:hypothetical protein